MLFRSMKCIILLRFTKYAQIIDVVTVHTGRSSIVNIDVQIHRFDSVDILRRKLVTVDNKNELEGKVSFLSIVCGLLIFAEP